MTARGGVIHNAVIYIKVIIMKSNYTNKKLICTNPDLTVHRGNVEEYCAGKIAEIFEILGGEVIYFGKPHKEIYLSCLEKIQKTLIIGDNLKTDIKGANNMKLDSLFITSGVHRSKINNEEFILELLKKIKRRWQICVANEILCIRK